MSEAMTEPGRVRITVELPGQPALAVVFPRATSCDLLMVPHTSGPLEIGGALFPSSVVGADFRLSIKADQSDDGVAVEWTHE